MEEMMVKLPKGIEERMEILIAEKVDSIIVKDRHFTDQDVVTALTPKQLLEKMGLRAFDSDL